MPARLLVIDDNAELRMQAIARIRSSLPDVDAVEATGEAEFERALNEPEFDAVLAGARLGWATGAQVLHSARRRWPDMPVVLYHEADEVADSVRTALLLSGRRRERRATESLFRIMFEQSLSGLYIGSLDGSLVDCNPAFARMFGYDSPEEVRGKHATDFVENPEEVDLGRARMIAQGGSLTNVEANGRRRDGSLFHALYSARMHETAEGTLVIATLIDVTESHHARAELRQAAQEWRTTFDGISSPILVVGADGIVVRINAAGRALAGHDYPTLIGQSLASISSGEPWRAATEVARVAVESPRPVTANVHDPGTRFTWEISAFPVVLPGQTEAHIAMVFRDITELIELQESVVRGQTMSTLGQLIAGVAHEVRSPLFGISATLDAFEARYGAEPAFRRYLDNLRRELDRMNELMHDLLELGRPATTDRQPHPIGSIVTEALESCTSLAGERQILLRDLVSPVTRSRFVLCDRRGILQVLENLLKNAIQHAPSGTGVEVVEDDSGSPTDVCISVADHGPGFRAEDLPHLFEPFFTRRTGGTGLGLAIVRRIVEDHGGKVDAQNQRGGGARVRVTLPVHVAGAPA